MKELKVVNLVEGDLLVVLKLEGVKSANRGNTLERKLRHVSIAHRDFILVKDPVVAPFVVAVLSHHHFKINVLHVLGGNSLVLAMLLVKYVRVAHMQNREHLAVVFVVAAKYPMKGVMSV